MGNKFLDRVQQENRQWFDAGQDIGWQKCLDYLELALRDPDVVGKDTFGHDRIVKLFEGIKKYAARYSGAFSNDVDSDQLREQLDANLREIWGDELAPFEQRYPEVIRIRYGKSRKGWR